MRPSSSASVFSRGATAAGSRTGSTPLRRALIGTSAGSSDRPGIPTRSTCLSSTGSRSPRATVSRVRGGARAAGPRGVAEASGSLEGGSSRRICAGASAAAWRPRPLDRGASPAGRRPGGPAWPRRHSGTRARRGSAESTSAPRPPSRMLLAHIDRRSASGCTEQRLLHLRHHAPGRPPPGAAARTPRPRRRARAAPGRAPGCAPARRRSPRALRPRPRARRRRTARPGPLLAVGPPSPPPPHHHRPQHPEPRRELLGERPLHVHRQPPRRPAPHPRDVDAPLVDPRAPPVPRTVPATEPPAAAAPGRTPIPRAAASPPSSRRSPLVRVRTQSTTSGRASARSRSGSSASEATTCTRKPGKRPLRRAGRQHQRQRPARSRDPPRRRHPEMAPAQEVLRGADRHAQPGEVAGDQR